MTSRSLPGFNAEGALHKTRYGYDAVFAGVSSTEASNQLVPLLMQRASGLRVGGWDRHVR